MAANYQLLNRDPHAEGIVIVDVTGKNNLDKPIVIFDELGIPCYWIFDNDRDKGAGKPGSPKANRILQRLSNIARENCVDWPDGVFDRFAAWDCDLEEYVKQRAGQQLFDKVRTLIADEFHIDPDMALKFPASAAGILFQLNESGVAFPELNSVIEKIDNLIDRGL